MLLNRLHVEDRRVLARGRRAALEVTRPLDGVWRLRIVPVAELAADSLPPKHSFAVVGGGSPLPFAADDETWTCSSGGDALALSRDGAFELTAGGTRVVRAVGWSGRAEPEFPRTRFESALVLAAPEDEGYYGFGEKVGPLNKRGMRFTFWNTDVWPHEPSTDPLYQSIPFFLGLRGGRAWGLFLDEPARSRVDIAQRDPERLEWTVEGPELDVYLILGPRPADVLRRYTDLAGRTPLPPLWALGAHQSRWGYESETEIRTIVEGYRARDLPLDAVHLDIDYMNAYKVFTFDADRYPDPKGLADWAGEQGVRLITIVDPGVKLEAGYRIYEEAREREFLVRTDRGDVLRGEVWPEPAVFPDFTREAVRDWWGEQHRFLIERGIGGVWNDMNEPSCFTIHNEHDADRVMGKTLPDDARHGTRRHVEAHNVYGLTMCQGTWEGLRRLAPERRPFVLTRAGYAGIQRYAAVWTGDNSSHWEHLEMNLTMLLGLGLSGVPFVGSDIGGFVGHSSGELLARWTQLGAFYPLMRNHTAKGTAAQEPWAFGAAYLEPIRAAMTLRYRLLPYLYGLMKEAAETGAPPMRPMLWHYPEDRRAVDLSDQFLLGEDLLIAPVLRPYHRHRAVYLPTAGEGGDWVRVDRDGENRGYAPGLHALDSELAEIPMLLRPGGIVPLAEPALHTGTARWRNVTWLANASASGSYSLHEDDGDGYGPSATRTVRLEREANRVRLIGSGDATGPDGERWMVFGLPDSARASGGGTATREGGALVVDAGGRRGADIAIEF
jgi:alpha-glucosidase